MCAAGGGTASGASASGRGNARWAAGQGCSAQPAGSGLGERMHHFPSQLSGGEQQRVAIARAVAKQPEVLLCDEPTGALDVHTGIIVLEAIDRINRELGTTTVVITHNVTIASMADRVISLLDGRIVQEHRNTEKVPPRKLEW